MMKNRAIAARIYYEQDQQSLADKLCMGIQQVLQEYFPESDQSPSVQEIDIGDLNHEKGDIMSITTNVLKRQAQDNGTPVSPITLTIVHLDQLRSGKRSCVVVLTSTGVTVASEDELQRQLLLILSATETTICEERDAENKDSMLGSVQKDYLAQYTAAPVGTFFADRNRDQHKFTIKGNGKNEISEQQHSHFEFGALPDQLSHDLLQLARDKNVSIHDLMLTLFTLLVHRHSGSTMDEFVIGLSTDVDHMLPILCQIPNENAVFDAQLLKQMIEIVQNAKETFKHGIPLRDTVHYQSTHAAGDGDKDLNHSLLQLRLLFSASESRRFDKNDNNTQNDRSNNAIIIEEIGPIVHLFLPEQYDIGFRIYISEQKEGSQPSIHINILYRGEFFNRGTIERIARHFVELASSVVNQPSQNISLLNMITNEERQQILHEWSQTGDDFHDDLDVVTIHDLLERQLERHPDVIALIQQSRQMTYREFHCRANQLAHHLRHAIGIGPENIVPILMPKSPECLVSMVAVLKAGGAFVYVDPQFPAERVQHMTEDVKAMVTMVHRTTLDSWKTIVTDNKIVNIETVLVDLEDEQGWIPFKNNPSMNLPSVSSPDDLAIIQFTSGSTGRPKGVSIEHRNMCNLLLNNPNDIKTGYRMLHWASMTYIVGMREWLQCLASGGTLIMPAMGELPIGSNLSKIIDEFGAQTMTLTASALNTMQMPPPTSLRHVSLSGEAVSTSLAHRFLAIPDLEMWMNFGASECSGMIARVRMQYDRPVTCIGKTLKNMRIYILDKHMQAVPVGVPGDLYFGGTCVARGYLERPDLDEGKFLLGNPFLTKDQEERHGGKFSRLYKTGDLARWLPNGMVEYLARSDNVVKIRGMRIELDEIKVAIMEQWGSDKLQDVAVAAKVKTQDQQEQSDAMVVAYLVPKDTFSKDDLSIEELYGQLRQKLPSFMVPTGFVFLDALPLNRSAKLDFGKLPFPDVESIIGVNNSKREFVVPRNEFEEKLAQIWSEVLDVPSEQISATDDFFSLGGHSLSMTRVATRIQETYQREVSLTTLFERSALEEMAILLSAEPNIGSEDGVSALRKDLLTASDSRPSHLPLSFSQRRLWLMDELLDQDEIKSVYNLNAVYRMRGNIDRQALYKAYVSLIDRHEVLRTIFQQSTIDDGMEQVILPTKQAINFRWTVIMQDESIEERIERAKDLALFEVTKSFNLTEGPLIRALVIEMDIHDIVMSITVHHTVFDGWSRGVLIRELAELYNARVEEREPILPELPVQYADYAIWQRQKLHQSGILETQLDFWKRHLEGAPDALELPLDSGKKRPTTQTYRGDTHRFEIDSSTADSLRLLARRERSTLFMLILSVYYVLLCRHSNQSDLVVGVAIANRRFRELENMIGFFVNMLALRVQIDDNDSLKSLLKRVRNTTLQAYENQDIPFEQVIDAMKVYRDGSRNPLFQAAFGLQTAARAGDVALDLSGGVQTSPFDMKHSLAMFDLTLLGNELDDGRISFTLEYSTELFSKSTIAMMADRFHVLLKSIIEETGLDISLWNLDMIPPGERHLLLNEWSGHVGVPYPDETTIHHIFEQVAERHPNMIAIIFEEQQLTFRELNEKANQFARYLRGRIEIAPETLISVCLHKSIEYVITVLAILKAGAGYLPIDPNLPRDRIAYYIEDSGSTVLMVHAQTKGHLTKYEDINLITIDVEESLYRARDIAVDNLGETSAPNNLAYVIYTSGSTGLPKGSQIEHRSLCNLCNWAGEMFQLSPGKRVMMFASLSFDASVADIFPTLMYASTLVVPNSTSYVSLVGDELQEFLSRHRVTTVTLPPVALSTLEDEGTLESVIIAGETSSEQVVRQWYRRVRLINGYGPSETTIGSSYHHYDPKLEKEITSVRNIGKPLKNVKYYILDKHMQPVPVGVHGELYIGGVGVGRGYINRPNLNREVFLENPFMKAQSHGGKYAKMYKTGDLVRWMPDGNVEYIGRVDRQVKIRGFRIELGEIESALEQYFSANEETLQLQQCVVVDSSTGSTEQRQLVVYLSFRDLDSVSRNATAESAALRSRQYLTSRLPHYMIPNVMYVLPSNKLPLNSSGKVDIKSLSLPTKEQLNSWNAVLIQLDNAGTDGTPARDDMVEIRSGEAHNDLEQILVDVWNNVLHRTDGSISREMSFFEAGGNSITAVSLLRQIKKRLATLESVNQLQLVHIFQYPTIRQLAQYLSPSQTFTEESSSYESERTGKEENKRDIAIIGLACRVPGASNPMEFWQNLCNGVESIEEWNREEIDRLSATMEELTHNPNFVPTKGGSLERGVFEQFDPSFFGFSQREAALIDPQHRLLLECCWEAIEQSGHDPMKLKGSNIGVFAGAGLNHYLMNHLAPLLHDKSKSGPSPAEQYAILTSQISMAPRIAFKLGLTGPAISVDTACSTSLVSVAMACASLRDGQCSMALAGGVALGDCSEDRMGYLYQEGMIRSKDGHCRTFDQDATGTVPGQGCGVVLLKNLEDAQRDGDTIYAVIKGIGVNNDGDRKMGFTAPSVAGQTSVILNALRDANVDPRTISFVECHGTATKLGDMIEINALTQAYQQFTKDKAFCGVGSVKSNIGHLDAAAGIAGLIKTVLALHYGAIPPTLHFKEPNPELALETSPFYVVDKLRPWPTDQGQRRAAVSSMGIGGTNAHIVLEEAPRSQREETFTETSRDLNYHVLPISARTLKSLRMQCERLHQYLSNNKVNGRRNLEDISYSLAHTRTHFMEHRLSIVCRDVPDAMKQLKQHISSLRATELKGSASSLRHIQQQNSKHTVLLFPGRGAQFAGMASDLYSAEESFRVTVDKCLDYVSRTFLQVVGHLKLEGTKGYKHTFNMIGYENCDSAAFQDTMLFTIEYSLAMWLMSAMCVKPSALCGHSMGEYVAVCCAGLLSLETALSLVVRRGLVIDLFRMEHVNNGAMLLIDRWLPVDEARSVINAQFPEIDIATINSRDCFTVAGPLSEIEKLRNHIANDDSAIARIISNDGGIAFHSRQVERLLQDLHKEFTVELSAHITQERQGTSTYAVTSCITGELHDSDLSLYDADYWCKHIRKPVQFSRQIESIVDHFGRHSSKFVFIEVGPGAFLTRMASRICNQTGTPASFATTMRPANPRSSQNITDVQALFDCVGRMWSHQVQLDWDKFFSRNGTRVYSKLSLPTYPFDRRRCWINPPAGAIARFTAPVIRITDSDYAEQVQEHQDQKTSTIQIVSDAVKEEWQHVLGMDGQVTPDLAINADFFALGGDSLTAAELAHRISRRLNLSISSALIIDNPELSALIVVLEERYNSAHQQEETIANGSTIKIPSSEPSSSSRPSLQKAASSFSLKKIKTARGRLEVPLLSSSRTQQYRKSRDLVNGVDRSESTLLKSNSNGISTQEITTTLTNSSPQLQRSTSASNVLSMASAPLMTQADRVEALRSLPLLKERRRSLSSSSSTLINTVRSERHLMLLYEPFIDNVSERETPVLVMVHPMSGDITAFSPMARLFREKHLPVRFYACRSPVLNSNVNSYKTDTMSVKSLAMTYITEMLELFPEKTTFFVGGYSFGGLVAVEMARVLDALGMQVPLLIMCDVPGPKVVQEMEQANRDKNDDGEEEFINAMERAMPLYMKQAEGNDIDPSPANSGLHRLRQQTKETGSYFHRILTAWKQHAKAMYAHARMTSKPFSIGQTYVLFFSCSESAGIGLPTDLHREWTETEDDSKSIFSSPTTVSVEMMDTDHWRMMQQPQKMVNVIGNFLQSNASTNP